MPAARCLVLLFALTVASARGAAILNVGSLVIDRYEKVMGPPDTGGGIDFQLHYELNADFRKQDCCDEKNLRWLQLAQVIPDQKNLPKGQFIDGPPGGVIATDGEKKIERDKLPWYDLTFKSKADLEDPSKLQRGSGPYLVDTPFAGYGNGSLEFIAWTLLVCILNPEANMQIIILGGVRWGYTNTVDPKDDKNNKTVKSELKPLAANDAKLRDMFNAGLDNALDTDGVTKLWKGWDVVDAAGVYRTCPAVTIPEPACSGLVLLGLIAIGLRRSGKTCARRDFSTRSV